MSASDDEDVLRQGWADFCDELKKAGEIPFRATVPPHVNDRTAGFEVLARNISLALNFQHDYADPLHPELIHYFDPVRKQGGDNTDAVYVGATINGTDTYRISGLPAGAITNPGIDAIAAALNPDQEYLDEGYYFFVTGNPNGDHPGEYFYAKTADEHHQNCIIAGWG